jgi:outer membrane biosynthesis protein TonB
VHIVSGNPVLTKAAVEAVKKWKFTPVMEDGKPARAVAPISLEFKM